MVPLPPARQRVQLPWQRRRGVADGVRVRARVPRETVRVALIVTFHSPPSRNPSEHDKSSYLHEASDVLLLLQEVLVQSTPVGHQLQDLALPEEGIFPLLLAAAAGAAISERRQGGNSQFVLGVCG